LERRLRSRDVDGVLHALVYIQASKSLTQHSLTAMTINTETFFLRPPIAVFPLCMLGH
jgi:hypothetical protein